MKKLFTSLMVVLLALSLLTGCGGGSKTKPSNKYEDGRLYNAFTLATTLTPAFDGYANWHSDMINPYGTGNSSNSARFVNAKNDELLLKMRNANPITGKDEYQAAYLEWVKLMNEELPLLPLYANDYHDLYNANVKNFKTGPMWDWTRAIVEATGVDTFAAGNTSFNGEFLSGWGNSAYDNNIRKLVFGGGLLDISYGGEMMPNFMVETLTVNDDQTVWNFKLKKGVKWHDGEELTAQDVRFTYLWKLHPTFTEAGGSTSYQTASMTIDGAQAYIDSCNAEGVCDPDAFTGIKIVNDYEIEFHIGTPIYTTWTTVFNENYVVPEHYYAPDGKIDVNAIKNLVSKPLGAGPYKFIEYLEGQYVKLEVNKDYPGNVHGIKPTIGTIIVKVVPEETEVEQLISGDIDLLAGQVQATNIDAAKAEKHLTFNNYVRHGYGHMTFHTDIGPTQYTEFRQAVAYAIDRQKFSEDFLGKYGVVTQGPYSTNYWMIDEAWVEKNLINYTYDPAKAKSLLEDNGWTMGKDGVYEKDGIKAVVSVAAGTQDWADSLNIVTNKSVEETGIYFDVNPIDFAVLLEHYYGTFKGN